MLTGAEVLYIVELALVVLPVLGVGYGILNKIFK